MFVGEKIFEEINKIGIIGAKGKTTTAKLIMDLLNRNKMRSIHLKGSQLFDVDDKEKPEFEEAAGIMNNTDVGGGLRATPRTNKFQQIIDKIHNDKIQIAIIELSTSDLEKAITNKFQFDSIIHTNTYISEKKSISNDKNLEMIKKRPLRLLSKNGTAIINIDDKSHMQIVEGIGNNIVVPYGFSSKATLTASSIETSSPIVKFTCCLQRGITNKNNIEVEAMEFPVNTGMEGTYNIQNALAAIAQALLLGVSPETISSSFSERKKYSL